MEDAATSEISRAQIWQWIHNSKGILNDGRKVTKELYYELVKDELEKIRSMVGNERFENGKFLLAAELINKLSAEDEFGEFLTLEAYEKIN
jgi:malate synthase